MLPAKLYHYMLIGTKLLVIPLTREQFAKFHRNKNEPSIKHRPAVGCINEFALLVRTRFKLFCSCCQPLRGLSFLFQNALSSTFNPSPRPPTS